MKLATTPSLQCVRGCSIRLRLALVEVRPRGQSMSSALKLTRYMKQDIQNMICTLLFRWFFMSEKKKARAVMQKLRKPQQKNLLQNTIRVRSRYVVIF